MSQALLGSSFKMKNFLIIAILLFNISCKSQVIGTLEQFEECSRRPNRDTEGCPDLENITYVKDTNNRLNQFVGTWKGTFNGRSYEFRFIKKIYFGDSNRKWDKIIGRIFIKDSNGNTLYNSLDIIDDNKTYFFGDNFQNRVYVMSFVNDSVCNGGGDVFIEVSKYDSNKMYLHFDKDTGIYNPEKCPNYDTYVPLLPKEKIILVKQ